MRFSDRPGTDLDSALGKEWLETNGIGGFASSTIVGLNTRRYHGLLVAATHPPVGRMVLLSKFEETLIVVGERFELSANQYPGGVVHPQGNLHLEEFRLDPFPIFVYKAGGVRIEKRVFLVQGENTAVVEYELLTPSMCQLEIRPLIAFRDYHSLTHRNDFLNAQFETAPQCVTIAPYSGLPGMHFAHDASSVGATGDWYFNFCYRVEEERGLDAREDLFNPFVLEFDLTNTHSAAVIASTSERSILQAADLRKREIARRASIRNAAPADAFLRHLTAAADQFIVKRGDLHTVIAGYHWFSDWGRDTMIALPGITLATGRFDIAKNILRTFAGAVDRGMLPNRWPDAGETPEYNTADATLWFFEAAGALACYTGDYDFVFAHLWEVLNSIIDWHLRGTRFGIHVNDRGLIVCGEQGSQLTWMDVKIGDHAVTPRKGMPVEIEALWYNALRTMEDFAVRRNEAAASQKFGEMAARAKESFDELFWNEGAGCLFDVVDGEIRDASIRPNQIFAVSLTYPILTGERAARVFERVERDLLTPRGLRSLSKDDPQYRPHYQGPPWDRDTAYHQGTVWPWLLGPFVSGYLRVNEYSAAAQEKADAWLRGLEDHLREAGLGQISEIFDGDAPHTPRGCIAQAWSVGEILRALMEDVLRQRPSVQNITHSR
ncbi:MAG TPA: amylo-alpha-1,6-glucosidase [Bryobacteraceae bacterium]|jgi:predicted glycogen debranching enzyme